MGRPLSDITHKLTDGSLLLDAKKVLTDLAPIEREVKMGSDAWFLTRIAPYRTAEDRIAGVVATFIDITRRRQTEEELRESEERFRLLVEGAPDYAMFLLEPDSKIIYWSAGAEKIFGWTAEEAVGQEGCLIFTPEDRAHGVVEKEIATAREKGHAPDRRWHLRKDGSRLWIDGVMRRLDHNDGTLRGFAKIARDATEAHQIEKKIVHARDELEQRVLERTNDLLATNTELERAMKEREQLERQLLDISEREKRRIGQDLHDIVCQELTATALFLKSAANKSKDPTASESLNEAAQIVNRNVTLARDLARGFQPVELSGGALTAALQSLAGQIN
jgi:two-component system CheB/CheR fusion protein